MFPFIEVSHMVVRQMGFEPICLVSHGFGARCVCQFRHWRDHIIIKGDSGCRVNGREQILWHVHIVHVEIV